MTAHASLSVAAPGADPDRGASEGRNALTLTATMVERDALRYTPAGIPVLHARVAHCSRQSEAGSARAVELEIPVMFAGRLADRMAGLPIGQLLELSGFLAPRRKLSKTLVLHVTACEVIERNNEPNQRIESNEV